MDVELLVVNSLMESYMYLAQVGFLTTQHTVGIITAETLRGDGAGLTNLPNVTTAR